MVISVSPFYLTLACLLPKRLGFVAQKLIAQHFNTKGRGMIFFYAFFLTNILEFFLEVLNWQKPAPRGTRVKDMRANAIICPHIWRPRRDSNSQPTDSKAC
jgi:hypothetical protein